jgi:hypothetical protein
VQPQASEFGMDPALLHVFTPRFNPLGFQAPHNNWERFARHMLESGVHLTVIECVSPGEGFHCMTPPMSDPAHAARFKHIGVYAKSRAWTKEVLINIGVQRTPEAEYLAWVDGDILFRRADWASATVKALLHYDIVQNWRTCLDLGPNGEIMAQHTSFCHQMFHGKPLAPPDWKTPYWLGSGGTETYPHSGYSWSATRRVWDAVGGLFEYGAMGSADHHQALGLAGLAHKTLPPGDTSANYCAEVLRWERRALKAINGNVGFVDGVIEHFWHGSKKARNYIGRWGMFLQHGFDPLEDLIRNSHGVWEFATAKPLLRRAFDRYLQSRQEDANVM